MNIVQDTRLKILLTLLGGLLLSLQTYAYEPSEGQMAPDFSITQLDGTQFKLSDYRGKQSVYVVFWNTWCHYCMKKIPKLKAVQKSLSNDIKIIAVNTSRDDSVQESLDFQKRFDINYALSFDTGEKVTDLYNVHGVPTEFIIDINGMIKHRDGVPDRLEDYVDLWNLTPQQTSQILLNGIKILNKLAQKFTAVI
jgi:peroxiredoxin